MQVVYNPHIKPITRGQFVDDYLEDEAEGKHEMDAMFGVERYPNDENGVFVPTDKNSLKNLRMVEQTLHTAYGHEK